MGMLLAGEHPALAVLRDQLAAAEVIEREFSGVGFFTHFRVPACSPRLVLRHRRSDRLESRQLITRNQKLDRARLARRSPD